MRGQDRGIDAIKVQVGGQRHDHDPPILRRRAARRNGNSKPMRFVSLHHHSTFSYKDGFQLPEAHVRRATELGMGAMAMTEHGNVSSHVKFELAARAAGVQPIFGCEVYTGAVGEGAKQTKYHLTLLAKNQIGYRNLMALVSRSFAEGFYYEPTVSWAMLRGHKKGLIVLSGCQGSLLACSTVGGKDVPSSEASLRRGISVAKKFAREFGENYFIEVQAFPELEKSCEFNALAGEIARACGRRLVATMDCHYTTLEEAEVQMILHNIRGGTRQTIEEQAREWGYDVPLCPPPNDRSIYRRLRATGLSKDEAVEAIVSTEEIAQSSRVEIPSLPPVRFRTDNGEDPQDVWERWLREGWKERGYDRLPKSERKRAREMLLKERSVMESKGFVEYLLIVADAVRYIKDLGIFVGWARGSAAASVVCYLLRITEVNPLDYDNLVFERFIDVTREDLPDVDLDFPSEARNVLRDYLVERYGNVYNIGTFTYFRNKLAVDDVARVFRIPKYEVEVLKDLLVERSSGDLRASSTIEDTADQFPQAREIFERYPDLRKAQLLEGNVKGFGVHSAGLVVSNRPVEEEGVCAFYRRELRGQPVEVVSIDKYDAEEKGLVKMDFLGLNTASQIEASLRYLGMAPSDIYEMGVDDEKVLDAFRENDVVGIFQFDGRACRSVNGMLKPDNFDEICDVSALARPGSFHNGAAAAYAEIKHGSRRAEKVHPAVDSILAQTKYQIVYQEQILRICREVGNFPWTALAEVRKIIAKKHGEQAFNRKKAEFLRGALTVHERLDVPPMTEEVALRVWGEMITAGSYGFNAAHTVSYARLSYFTMWLKVYHPAVFYATGMTVTPHREKELLRDAAAHDVDIRPPDPERSEANWTPIDGERAILAGFGQIDGIGEKTAAAIVDFRDEHGLTDWSDLSRIRGIGPKTVERIQEWMKSDDPFGAFVFTRDLASIRAALERGELGDAPSPTHRSRDIPQGKGESAHVVWTGILVARNIRDLFEQNRAKKGEELSRDSVKNPDLNEYAILWAEDEDEMLSLKIEREDFPRFKDAIFGCRIGRDAVLVDAYKKSFSPYRKLHVKRMLVIEP